MWFCFYKSHSLIAAIRGGRHAPHRLHIYISACSHLSMKRNAEEFNHHCAQLRPCEVLYILVRSVPGLHMFYELEAFHTVTSM